MESFASSHSFYYSNEKCIKSVARSHMSPVHHMQPWTHSCPEIWFIASQNEGCEAAHFKQRAFTEFLTAGKESSC